MAVGNMEKTTAWTQLSRVYRGMDSKAVGTWVFSRHGSARWTNTLGTPHMDVPSQYFFLWWICSCMGCINRGQRQSDHRLWCYTEVDLPECAFILKETCGPVWGSGDGKLEVGEALFSARAFDESQL